MHLAIDQVEVDKWTLAALARYEANRLRVLTFRQFSTTEYDFQIGIHFIQSWKLTETHARQSILLTF